GSLLNVEELFGINFGKSLVVIITVIILGFLTKLIGCYIPARLLGFSHRDSLVIGVGMVPRAEVMMTVALAAKDSGIMGSSTYLGLILLLPITSLIVPPLIAKLYR
ncbi:MAG TPA: hypothetical protein ENF42_04035, partial [Candidatus Bathyarchaeota archaeon]|nr:hypothetical protein [Candidatus Bathyarchaeota archaeon]